MAIFAIVLGRRFVFRKLSDVHLEKKYTEQKFVFQIGSIHPQEINEAFHSMLPLNNSVALLLKVQTTKRNPLTPSYSSNVS